MRGKKMKRVGVEEGEERGPIEEDSFICRCNFEGRLLDEPTGDAVLK